MSRPAKEIDIDIAKLRDYCLNLQHRRGKHKARVFQAALGLTEVHADLLRRAIFDAAHDADAAFHPAEVDEFGKRFTLDFAMTTGAGLATIRTGWILLTGETVLRLTTCFVLQRK